MSSRNVLRKSAPSCLARSLTVTYLAIYLISVIGTSAKWITCVATEPKSRP